MAIHRFSVLLMAFSLLAACSPAPAGEQAGQGVIGEVDGVPFLEMRAERLPDLPKPRGGHHIMQIGDEITLIGGITDGFILEPSIACLKDGVWSEVPMKYPHYYGFTTLLPDGKVMLGGGCADNFGIGQSWGVEIYDPATHSCKAAAILDRKRSGVSALALPDGRVAVSGNWYEDDAVALYEPGKGFISTKDVATPRTYPLILSYSPNNALIFSGKSTKNGPAEALVDRLHGEPFREPLLEEWDVTPGPLTPCSEDQLRIGEDTWLIPARRYSDQAFGILKLAGERFTVLGMDHPVPMVSPAGDSIVWYNCLQVDHTRRKAWIQGFDYSHIYAGVIDYDATLDGGKASLCINCAEKRDGGFPIGMALLLPEDRLLLAGGVKLDYDSGKVYVNNFTCYSEVWMFHTAATETASKAWGWLAGGILIAAVAALSVFLLKRRNRRLSAAETPQAVETESKLNANLLEQMSKLIEEKELYKRKDLHLSDIASELASNKTYVSILLNSISGTKFTTLVNGYRIRYAQQLMLRYPDMLLDDIAEQAGFSSRSTFFRNFKAQTGMTPMQWIVQQKGDTAHP